MDHDTNNLHHLSGEGNPRKIKVLLYHHVVDDESLCRKRNDMCVHVNDFRQHLNLLDRWGYTPITFADYRFFIEGELNLPKKPVIITFDDGYESVYNYAFPILQEFGMKAVCFAIGDRKINRSIWDQVDGKQSLPLMTDEQLLELNEAGFEIGGHTLTHAKISTLSHEKAWEEISRSRMLLEILLNAPVKTFAYPFGIVNDSCKQMVKDAGYTIGCSTFSGPPVFGEDLFEIRRILIRGNVDSISFAMRVLAPYQHYSWLKWRIKQTLTNKSQSDFSNSELNDNILR